MQPGDRLFAWCEGVLDALEAWEFSNPDGWQLPERRVIAHGTPALDCELVAVWCQGTLGYAGDVLITGGGPLNPSAPKSMRTATIGITIARCDLSASELDIAANSEAQLPSPFSVTETARATYADQSATMNALLAATRAGVFGEHQWAPISWTPDEPDGGLAASTLLIQVGLVIAPV